MTGYCGPGPIKNDEGGRLPKLRTGHLNAEIPTNSAWYRLRKQLSSQDQEPPFLRARITTNAIKSAKMTFAWKAAGLT